VSEIFRTREAARIALDERMNLKNRGWSAAVSRSEVYNQKLSTPKTEERILLKLREVRKSLASRPPGWEGGADKQEQRPKHISLKKRGPQEGIERKMY